MPDALCRGDVGTPSVPHSSIAHNSDHCPWPRVAGAADISGEDPVLGATLVKPLIHGIQQHVMAIAKHYILNNQARGYMY